MKSELRFSQAAIVATDVTPLGLLAVHRPLCPKPKGFVVTHIESRKIVAWAPKKAIAVHWRKQLEKAMDEEREEDYLRWLLHFMRTNG